MIYFSGPTRVGLKESPHAGILSSSEYPSHLKNNESEASMEFLTRPVCCSSDPKTLYYTPGQPCMSVSWVAADMLLFSEVAQRPTYKDRKMMMYY